MSIEQLNTALASCTIDDIEQLEAFRSRYTTRISDLKRQRTQARRDAEKASAEQTRADAKLKRETDAATEKRNREQEAAEKKEQKDTQRALKEDRLKALKKIKKHLVLPETKKSIFGTFSKNHKKARKTAAKVLSELEKLQGRLLKKTELRLAEEAKAVAKAQREAEREVKRQEKVAHAAGVAARKEAKIPKNEAYHAFGKYWTIARIEAELDEEYWPTEEQGKRGWNTWAYDILKQGKRTDSPEDLPEMVAEYA
tara:strand:+ start:782 stop:1546 length:765 start_codon:yes stop_codon:yes gene_type:complete